MPTVHQQLLSQKDLYRSRRRVTGVKRRVAVVEREGKESQTHYESLDDEYISVISRINASRRHGQYTRTTYYYSMSPSCA